MGTSAVIQSKKRASISLKEKGRWNGLERKQRPLGEAFLILKSASVTR